MEKANPNTNSRGIPPKKEKIPVKVKSDEKSDIIFVNQKGVLNNSFKIVLAYPNGSKQFTVHHPIGITDLEDHDWVLTESTMVHDLLDRQKDPALQRLQEARRGHLYKLAVEAKKLDSKDNAYVYPKSGLNRDALIAAARRLADKSIEKKVQQWKASTEALPKGEKRPPKPTPPDPIDFFRVEVKKEELDLREFLKDPANIKKAEEEYPQTFRTLGGTLRDQPQARINEKGKIVDQIEVIDQLVRYINTFEVQGGVPPAPKRSIEASVSEGLVDEVQHAE